MLRPVLLALLLGLAGHADAVDYFWVNSFGGIWDETIDYGGGVVGPSWKDAAGGFGLPGAGDNAFLVLPYAMALCSGNTCTTQPVPVTYRSEANPLRNRVVVDSDTMLTLRELSFVSLAQLNLSTNYLVVGSGGAYSPPPGVPFPNPPGVYPRGSVSQFAGSISVKTELVLGGAQLGFSTLPANPVEGLFRLDGGTLTVGEPSLGGVGIETIGRAGDGQFIQSGGTHLVHGTLVMAERTGSSGQLDLRGGSLDASAQIVGGAGQATVRHVGGSHGVGTLIVGLSAGAEGVYTLGPEGVLTVRGDAVVGAAGKGIFDGTGVSIGGNLILGRDAGGSGTLSTRALDIAGSLSVGEVGFGAFTHGNGTVNVGGDFRLGPGGAGVYTLRGGSLLVGGSGHVGPAGRFEHESGDASFAGALAMRGAYAMTSGQLVVNASGAAAGGQALDLTGEFRQQHGAVDVRGVATVNGTWDMTGVLPQVTARRLQLGTTDSSAANLSQRAGAITVTGLLSLGTEPYEYGDESPLSRNTNSQVLYAIDDAILTVDGHFHLRDANRTPQSAQGFAIVLHGSAAPASVTLNAGLSMGQGGHYELYAGSLDTSAASGSGDPALTHAYGTNALIVGGGAAALSSGPPNSAEFVQRGGSHQASGDITVGYRDNWSGRYTLSGGSLIVTGSLHVGRDGGLGVFEQDGRSTTAEIRGDAIVGPGGTIKAKNTELTILGELQLSGIYDTDPATLRVHGDVTVDPSGVMLAAAAGDLVVVGGSFHNRSGRSVQWDTRGATLQFDGEGAVAHAWRLPGVDRGASASGFAENFAWGAFGLGADDTLLLLDGNDTPGAGLYVGVVAEGTNLANVTSPFNIYYDPAQAGNAWLAGARIELGGGGFLAPVPEPRSALLAGLGVMMLAALRRRAPGR